MRARRQARARRDPVHATLDGGNGSRRQRRLPTWRSCFARHASGTCSPSHGAASACPRRARTSFRSRCRASSSTRSGRDRLARHLQALRGRHPGRPRAAADARGARARASLGQGGDETTAIDQAAEDVVVARLEARSEDFVLVSEELGERHSGRRVSGGSSSIPSTAQSTPSAESLSSRSRCGRRWPAMGDVTFGYVYDFGTGEEWTAERGAGAFLGGERSVPSARRRRSRSSRSRERRRRDRRPHRRRPRARRASARHGLPRVISVSSCGRSRRCRLLAQARTFGRHRRAPAPRARVRARDRALRDPPFAAAPLDLVTRSRVAAAGSPELVAELAAALR